LFTDQNLSALVGMADTVPRTSGQDLPDTSNLAIASWFDWTKVRAGKYVKIATFQNKWDCPFNEVSRSELEKVGDPFSSLINEINLILEREANCWDGMSQRDLTVCLMAS